jgi:hypothetical protein
MKLLFIYNLMGLMSGYVLQNMRTDTPFMTMNEGCYVAPAEKYACSDIPGILSMDPDERKDIEYVCNCSRTTGFTNEQLAKLSNQRLHESGLDFCTISVLDGLENTQLKDQCHTFYREKCVMVQSTL